ncbi:MAG: DUF5060 domain-containing protein [Alphaproteobacteria bacterium]|nr:DUF5060 domain-containing protein [Alphaproteobacteria bacterium]
MKMKKLCVSAAIVLVFLTVLSTAALAVNTNQNEESERTTYISQTEGTIEHGALSTTVYGKITGNSSVTSVKIKLELQKLTDGTYSTVETWEQVFTGRTGSLEKSKLTNPFGDYRLKAVFTAYVNSSSETITLYYYG